MQIFIKKKNGIQPYVFFFFMKMILASVRIFHLFLSVLLTASKYEVVLPPLLPLVFHCLAAAQEGLGTGFTIHNILTAHLTGV